jgi:hypothetical protein
MVHGHCKATQMMLESVSFEAWICWTICLAATSVVTLVKHSFRFISLLWLRDVQLSSRGPEVE